MEEKNKKISKSMEGNKNAEIWTKEKAIDFFELSINKATFELNEDGSREYDFIGELATDLQVDKSTYNYLTEKFPDLNPLKSRLLSVIESNCFRNSKKGKIREATAIVNLKSNYGWTDRQDYTSGNEKVEPVVINLGSGKNPNETTE